MSTEIPLEIEWYDSDNKLVRARFTLEVNDPHGGRIPLEQILLQALVSCTNYLSLFRTSRIKNYKEVVQEKLKAHIENQINRVWGLSLRSLSFELVND